MKEKIVPFLKQFLPFSVFLFFIQKTLVETYFTDYTFYYGTLSIYLFHSICTLLFFICLVFVNQTFFDKTGYTFLATGILKMMASIVFLLPLIQSDLADKKPDVIAFFIPFFLFLFFETIHSVRLLGQN